MICWRKFEASVRKYSCDERCECFRIVQKNKCKMDRICWSKKGQAMVQIFLETSGNALNSTSESIRLLKKLLNWKNSFAGSSKKDRRGHFLFQRQKCPVPELSGQDKMNCSKFLLLVTKSKKVLFFYCSQLQERQFCEISVVPIQEQTQRVGWFQDSFSPVSFSGFSSQHSPPIRGFVWLLIPSPPLPPSAPESEVSHLGRELRLSGDDGPRQEKFADRRDKNVCRGGSAKNGTRHREVKFQPRWNYFGDSGIWGLETRRLAKVVS